MLNFFKLLTPSSSTKDFINQRIPKNGIYKDFLFLINSLFEQLNKANVIKVKFQAGSCNELITFITEKEAEEMIPNHPWKSYKSNIRRFTRQEGDNLCKYISEYVIFKIILIRRLEDDIIEVNSVVPNIVYSTQYYNILNKDSYKSIEKYYSCPVYDCIWKPKSLSINSNLTDEILFSKYEDLNEEVTQKILEMPVFDGVKEMRVIRKMNNLLSIKNSFRIAKQFPLVKILIWIYYKFAKSDYRNLLHIRSNTLAFIFQGDEWNFESCYQCLMEINWKFSDFKLIENKNLVVLKIQSCETNGLVAKHKNILDCRVQPHIDDLKKSTISNDDLFVITDSNDMEFFLDLDKLEEYSEILKHFKLINIVLKCFEEDIRQRIEVINSLPKQYKYKIFIIQTDMFINEDGFNLIDNRFEDMTIVAKNFEIKRIKPRSVYVQTESNKKYIAWNLTSFKKSIVEIEQLTKLIKETYDSDSD